VQQIPKEGALSAKSYRGGEHNSNKKKYPIYRERCLELPAGSNGYQNAGTQSKKAPTPTSSEELKEEWDLRLLPERGGRD